MIPNVFFKVNTQKLIEAVDETAFLNQLSQAGLTPKRYSRNEIRFKESGGLSLFLDRKTNVWRIHNHSAKTDVPNGNIWQFTRALHGIQLRTPDDFLQVLNIVCQAAGLNPDRFTFESAGVIPGSYLGHNRVITGKHLGSTWEAPKQNTAGIQRAKQCIKPADDQAPKLKYKFAEWESEQGRAVLEYFRNKAGATLETLQRYNIRPLLETTHGASGRTKRYSASDFAFAYIVPNESGTIKYKRPNAAKEYRERYIKNGTAKYVFGLDQLPDKCDMIIIAAGEADTLAINQHFNEYRVFAICLRSETDTIDPDIIACLRAKAETVICLYDNDATGENQMRKIARVHGLPFIRIAEFVNDPNKYPGVYEAGINKTLNDVCDIYQRAGIDTLRKIIATAYRHTDTRDDDDERIIYQDYLSEDPESLKGAILRNVWINLKGATGAAKTWAFIAIALDSEFMNTAGARRCIIAVPTRMLGQQLQSDLMREHGYNVPFVSGMDQHAQNVNAPFYIATYDSLKKIDDVLHESILIVDESHLLAEQYNFRQTACSEVYRYFTHAHKTVLISATPHEYNGFTKITACGGNVQRFNIQPVYYSGKAIEIDIQAPKPGHVTIIQYNDLDRLKALQLKCQRAGILSTIISSQENEAYTEKNQHYQELIRTGTTSAQIILCTNLIDTGISIKQPIDSVHCFKPDTDRKLLQLIARGRKRGDTNSEIKAYVYHKRQTEYETVTHQHQAGRYSDYDKIHEAYYKAAAALANTFNDHLKVYRAISEYNPKGYDHFETVVYDDRAGAYIVNEPGVKHYAYKQYHSEISNAQFYNDVTAINPNATVLDPIEMVFTPDQETGAIAKELKQASKDAKISAFEVFEQNPDTCLEALYFTTNNGKLKGRIRNHIYIDRTISDKANELYQAHRELFDAGHMERPAHRYSEILSITGDADLSNKVVFGYQDKESYRAQYNAFLRTYKSESESAKAIHHRNECESIYQEHRKANKKQYTYTELKQLLIKAGIGRDRIKDAKSVLLLISQIWQYDKHRETTRNGKKTIYTIGNKWTKKALIEAANMAFEIAGLKSSQSIKKQWNNSEKTDTVNRYNTINNNADACPGFAPF